MTTKSGNIQTPCVPKFDGDYGHWRLIMENLLRSKEYWCVIKPGKSILKTITQKETAKQLWESMKVKYQGNARLRREFGTLEMKTGESVTDSTLEGFNFVVCSIEESKDIDTLMVDELQSSLLVLEQKVRRKVVEEQVLKVEYDFNSGRGRGRSNFARGSNSNFRGRGRGSLEKGVNYVEFDEGEELLLMSYAEIDETSTKQTWYLDSGCSNHMTGTKSCFVRIDVTFKRTVKLGNNSKLVVLGKGDIRFEIDGITQTITDVFFVPQLTTNLLSVGKLQEKGVTFVIGGGLCKIYHPQGGLITTSQLTPNRMFKVLAVMKPLSEKCLQVAELDTVDVWHNRYGHLNNKSIRTM
ncbi:hypothetical protein Tco_0462738 [Tanacetum coccineum]